MVKISASLASAPLYHLAATVRELEQAGVDMLHFDIEDGSFVPMMTLGTRILHELRPLSRLPFDVHLMMRNPEWLIPQLVNDGANRISVHIEACPYPRQVLRLISDLGVQAGLAFNPITPLPDLSYLDPYLKFIVILTTEPEGSDCPFLPTAMKKMRLARENGDYPKVEWVVDGAIHPENASEAVSCGADVLVVGRAIFQGGSVFQNIMNLRRGAS